MMEILVHPTGLWHRIEIEEILASLADSGRPQRTNEDFLHDIDDLESIEILEGTFLTNVEPIYRSGVFTDIEKRAYDEIAKIFLKRTAHRGKDGFGSWEEFRSTPFFNEFIDAVRKMLRLMHEREHKMRFIPSINAAEFEIKLIARREFQMEIKQGPKPCFEMPTKAFESRKRLKQFLESLAESTNQDQSSDELLGKLYQMQRLEPLTGECGKLWPSILTELGLSGEERGAYDRIARDYLHMLGAHGASRFDAWETLKATPFAQEFFGSIQNMLDVIAVRETDEDIVPVDK